MRRFLRALVYDYPESVMRNLTILVCCAMLTLVGLPVAYASLTVPSKGLRLTDGYSLAVAHNQMNNYAPQTVVAIGTTQATGVQTVNPLVFVNTSNASTGINLLKCDPGQLQHVTNQSGQTITAYAKQGTTDTINATAGATGVTIANNTAALFVCPVSGKWGKQ